MRILLTATFYAFFFATSIGSAEDLEQQVLHVICGDDSQLTIDTTGHQYFARFNNALAERIPISQIGSSWQIVPQKLLPQSLQMSRVDLLTSKGRTKAKIIEARIKYGASEVQLHLITDQKCNHDFPGGLVKLGKPLTSSAQLTRITEVTTATVTDGREIQVSAVTGSDPAVSKFTELFQKWVDINISDNQREIYRRLHITRSDFKLLEGRFRPGGRWLVWGELAWSEERERERESLEKIFEVGAILDSKGKTIEVIRVPQAWITCPGCEGAGTSWNPSFVIDLDSDGISEIVADISLYEGAGVTLYQWKNGKMTPIELQFDSA